MTQQQQDFLDTLPPHALFQLLEDIYFIGGPQLPELGSVRAINLAQAESLGLATDNGVTIALECVERCRGSSF